MVNGGTERVYLPADCANELLLIRGGAFFMKVHVLDMRRHIVAVEEALAANRTLVVPLASVLEC